MFGEPVVTTVCILLSHTGRGCHGHPAFPAPSVLSGQMFMQNSGASCRERAEACVLKDEPTTITDVVPALRRDPGASAIALIATPCRLV
jgi:hypothetical protein